MGDDDNFTIGKSPVEAVEEVTIGKNPVEAAEEVTIGKKDDPVEAAEEDHGMMGRKDQPEDRVVEFFRQQQNESAISRKTSLTKKSPVNQAAVAIDDVSRRNHFDLINQASECASNISKFSFGTLARSLTRQRSTEKHLENNNDNEVPVQPRHNVQSAISDADMLTLTNANVSYIHARTVGAGTANNSVCGPDEEENKKYKPHTRALVSPVQQAATTRGRAETNKVINNTAGHRNRYDSYHGTMGERALKSPTADDISELNELHLLRAVRNRVHSVDGFHLSDEVIDESNRSYLT